MGQSVTAGSCPKHTGSGAAAGNATCRFFAGADAHPEVKWFYISVLLILAFFCVRYLLTGKVLSRQSH